MTWSFEIIPVFTKWMNKFHNKFFSSFFPSSNFFTQSWMVCFTIWRNEKKKKFKLKIFYFFSRFGPQSGKMGRLIFGDWLRLRKFLGYLNIPRKFSNWTEKSVQLTPKRNPISSFNLRTEVKSPGLFTSRECISEVRSRVRMLQWCNHELWKE